MASLLTEEERFILEAKGTEAPFSGRFIYLKEEDGLAEYVCRKCGAALYASEHQFDSGCGWPSFDDSISGAVSRKPDADGRRVEIVCSKCDGHLGHVFEGEGKTSKNVRHCVNGKSLGMRPKPKETEDEDAVAVFGGGCFWCLEALFADIIGVKSVRAGYCGGSSSDTATYKQVCGGDTGHVEVVEIVYRPAIVSFGMLLELFFDCHDPTSIDCQGGDVGSQYRSVIFYQFESQRRSAEALIERLTQKKVYRSPIVTRVLSSEGLPFHVAEDHHQKYFATHGKEPYCKATIAPKMGKLKAKYADRYDKQMPR